MCEGKDPGIYRVAQLARPLELRGEPGKREPYDPASGDRVRVGLREVGDGAVHHKSISIFVTPAANKNWSQVVHWVTEHQRWYPIVELG